jgi:hypothetical protein
MKDSEQNIKSISNSVLSMILLDKLKTNNPIMDAIITTMMLTFVTYLFQWANTRTITIIRQIYENNICDLFYKKYCVEYEGKIASMSNYYDCHLSQTCIFSDSFKALWKHIIDNMEENDSIYAIKEYSTYKPYGDKSYEESKKQTFYMVNQNKPFMISKKYNIYAYATFDSENDENNNSNNNNNKQKSKIEKIVIILYSYTSNTDIIKLFVESITNRYLSTIEDLRCNKKFAYSLATTKYENNVLECWTENVFSSTRTFDNFFFEDKKLVLDKINFFMNNKEWYYKKGVPYSLGIGLHGPPGTGKTSFIKALTNYTKRHLIIISLKLIKTKRQLDQIFFEERYNCDNKRGSVSFDKKIIVFEDLDCIGDIVMDRNKKKTGSKKSLGKKLNISELTTSSKINVGDLLETMAEAEDANKKLCEFPKLPIGDDPITLDDILNILDGLLETPGRIFAISSNHYYDLDPALIRPGRIDLSLKLSYATHNVISEIYSHLFSEEIDKSKLKKIKPDFYSPAEIMNIYMNEDRDTNKFLKRMMENKHV